jgi:uncharacterized membrane protein
MLAGADRRYVARGTSANHNDVETSSHTFSQQAVSKKTDMSQQATRLFRRSRLSPRDDLAEYHGACRNGSFEHGAFWALVKTENSGAALEWGRLFPIRLLENSESEQEAKHWTRKRNIRRLDFATSAGVIIGSKDVLIPLSLPTPENPK